MKTLIVLVAILGVALARPPSRRMLCNEERLLSDRRGAVEGQGRDLADREITRSIPRQEEERPERKSMKTFPTPRRKVVVDEASVEEYGRDPTFPMNKYEAEGLFSFEEENKPTFRSGSINNRDVSRNFNPPHPQDPLGRGGSEEQGGQWEEFTPSRREMNKARNAPRHY